MQIAMQPSNGLHTFNSLWVWHEKLTTFKVLSTRLPDSQKKKSPSLTLIFQSGVDQQYMTPRFALFSSWKMLTDHPGRSWLFFFFFEELVGHDLIWSYWRSQKIFRYYTSYNEIVLLSFLENYESAVAVATCKKNLSSHVVPSKKRHRWVHFKLYIELNIITRPTRFIGFFFFFFLF